MISIIKPKDYEQCLNIYNYYILNTTVSFEEKSLSLLDFKKRILRIKKDYIFVVYKEKDKVLGYAYLDHFSLRSAYRISLDLSIYVDKNYLHKHIGQELLNYILNYAKNNQIENIISVVSDDNLGSIKFHLHNNFIEMGHLENIAYKMNQKLGIKYFVLNVKKK